MIGDVELLNGYSLPYMSGPDLCKLCTQFGLPKSYTWGGQNMSRWMYMEQLLEYLNKQDRIHELLDYLFTLGRFKELNSLGDIDKVTEIHRALVQSALNAINAELLIAKKELRLVNNRYVLANIGEKVVINTPKVNVVTQQYIRELPNRIKEDLANKDYDSVITKSRTLLEEVLIYIIEKLTMERYKSNGDLVKIYQDATELLNMRQKKDWDKRVNELLGGMHKMVSAISSMRNINSDAHGAGSGRIEIKEREALLASQSAMMLAEYWLSVYNGR
ncbi:MAG: abortive infection family protein [Prevotella sp.]|nr:abortive infection family protein [Prevotella sp.]